MTNQHDSARQTSGASDRQRPAGETIAERHLDWAEKEIDGRERAGEHPLGEMGDTTPPAEQRRQMAEAIRRGPGDDLSSAGGDIGTLGGDAGVLGGDPAGQPPGISGHVDRGIGGGTGEIGGLGGTAARQLGGLPPGSASLGGVGAAHAAGTGAGLDAAGTDLPADGTEPAGAVEQARRQRAESRPGVEQAERGTADRP